MINVIIEIWPGGDARKKRTLGSVKIANIGGTEQMGEYKAILMKSSEYTLNPGVWKRCELKAFPRKKLGPYDLLYRVLHSTVGSRNKEAVLAKDSKEKL